MYIPVWPHNGVKSFLEEHSYFSASVFFIPYDVLTVSAESAQMYTDKNILDDSYISRISRCGRTELLILNKSFYLK